jgi:hypothetical protein
MHNLCSFIYIQALTTEAEANLAEISTQQSLSLQENIAVKIALENQLTEMRGIYICIIHKCIN